MRLRAGLLAICGITALLVAGWGMSTGAANTRPHIVAYSPTVSPLKPLNPLLPTKKPWRS
jgi:hypothetical protein